MKARLRTGIRAVLLGLLGAVTLQAQQPTGQWDFEGGNLNATVGSPLQYIDGAGGATQTGTAFGTTTALGIPDIGGSPATVMRFPANTNNALGYNMPGPTAANGGGTLVNDWTIIMDVLFTGSSHSTLRGLVTTDRVADPDTDLFINANNQLGVGGFFGTVSSNTWHRVAMVVQASSNRLAFYIDGVQVGTRDAGGAGALDGRWALTPGGTAELFNDDDGGAASGYVNSIQVRDVALSKAQMAALAGPTAAGIPTTLPPIASFVENWIPSTPFARPTTDVGVVLNRGSSTISGFALTLDGVVRSPVITTNGDLYSLVVTSPGLPPLSDHTVIVAFTDSAAGAKSFTNTFRVPILYEDFELLTLGAAVDETAVPDATNVWTKTPPLNWSIDDSQMALTNLTTGDLVGVTEWRGWSFANKDWWVTVAGDQDRSQFSKGVGTVAIVDPDEWDDLGNPDGTAGYFWSFLTTQTIPMSGVAANTAFLRFDSSWRPECCDDSSPPDGTGPQTNNQTGIIWVSYDGGAPVQVLKWDSDSTSPTYHPDVSQNESVSVSLNNPAGATNAVITFRMENAANDWWWAVDNIAVDAGAAPPAITGQPVTMEVVEGQPGSFTVTASGSGLTYQWSKGLGVSKAVIPGATAATLSFSPVTIPDAGYYSVRVSGPGGSVDSGNVRLSVLPNLGGPIPRVVLLGEDFNGLALGANVDEGINTGTGGPTNNVWTKTPPTGWSIDDTGVPGAGDPANDGVTEWAGWSFANKEWWAAAGGQNRAAFLKATGAAAIADSDEWDDLAHAPGNMATYLKTREISLQGVKANSVVLSFDSSWNPENPQKANITVAFDGGAPVEVYRYESDPNSPTFHPAEFSETLTMLVSNPAGATNMVITFGYFETLNNWWYAIDNLQVLADRAPIFAENFESLVLGTNVDEGIITGSGGVQTNVWTKSPPAGWAIDDSGVPGVGDPAQDGVTEWAGWSFAKLSFWAAAGGQDRSTFTRGNGTVAVGDSDEWDDVTHAAGNMATFLATPNINIAGNAANTLYLKFDSSFRAEEPQKANIQASYDGGAPVEVLRWESAAASPNFHDNMNEAVTLALNNPAGANTVKLTFGYFDTRNNWWWAIDNLEVVAGTVVVPGDLGRVEAAIAGGNITLTWTDGPGVKLQKATSLSGTITWTDVPGAGTATEAVGAGNSYYRLFKP